jgi:plasmid replication initiation protein
MQTSIVTVLDNGGVRKSQLLGSNEISSSGVLTYEFPTRLSLILKESNVFAKLDLAVMGQFSSKYAFTLYEAISRRINLKHKFSEDLDIDGMRTLLSVEDGKLEAYRNLRIKAIEPAVAEVNAITPYNVTITPMNKGRKVIGFKMHWYVKDEQGLMKSYKELQSAKVGRTKRQEGAADTIIELPD